MQDEFEHLQKYIETGELERLKFSDYEPGYIDYMNNLSWAGSWLNWSNYDHFEIDYEDQNYAGIFVSKMNPKWTNMVFTFMTGSSHELESIKHVFVCEAKFGIEILNEIYWGFPPHQYGYFIDNRDEVRLSNPECFFETDIHRRLRIKI